MSVQLDINPVYNLGRYRNQPMLLSELPEDYLKWVAFAKKDEPLIRGTRNWETLAKQELERRAAGGEVTRGLEIEMDEEGNEFDPSLREQAVANMAQNVKADAPPPRERVSQTDTIYVTGSSIDDAADQLLKEFITRTDKKVRFIAWLEGLAKEAARLGHLLTDEEATDCPTDLRNPSPTLIYSYMGKYFLFSRESLELVRIIKEAPPG